MAGPEAKLERWARGYIAEAGGIMEKHTSPQKRGVRDNLVMWPGGIVDFIEFKAEGEPVEDHQARDHARCRALGQRVAVIRTRDQVFVYCHARRHWPAKFPAGLDR